MANISHFTQTVNGVSTTYDIHDADAVPRSGTNALAGSIVPDTDNAYNLGNGAYKFKSVNTNLLSTYQVAPNTDSGSLLLNYNTSYGGFLGGGLILRGTNSSVEAGCFNLSAKNGTIYATLRGTPSGTLTWTGQPIQYGSDARLKQQIAEIDDKLLDAWEDVEPSQFKYNDAVDQKGKDKARLHTGYVVQQIDKACKSHGVDISEYGLYCHEEYPQETEEVEVEQADGTKTKETKVIREASEHYSLRYTEVYAVECMYLRRCIKQLTARIEELEKGNNTK